jgi:hypothetical protein
MSGTTQMAGDVAEALRSLRAEAAQEASTLAALPAREQLGSATSQVARWVFASGELLGFEPYDPELFQFKRGRELASEPVDGPVHRFGFTDAGALVLCEHRASDSTSFEILVREGLTARYFLPTRAPLGLRVPALKSVTRRESLPGHTLCAMARAPGAQGVEWATREYRLDGAGRPTSLHFTTPHKSMSYLFAYDALGRLASIADSSVHQTIWKAPLATQREMLRWYEERLLAELVPLIERAVADHDAAVVALVHRGDGSLPPEVAIANIEAARAGKFDPYCMLGSVRGDDTPQLRISTPDLLEVGRMIDNGDPTAGPLLLRKVAAELTGRTWTGKTGPHTVAVYVVDLEASVAYDQQFAGSVKQPVRKRLGL